MEFVLEKPFGLGRGGDDYAPPIFHPLPVLNPPFPLILPPSRPQFFFLPGKNGDQDGHVQLLGVPGT